MIWNKINSLSRRARVLRGEYALVEYVDGTTEQIKLLDAVLYVDRGGDIKCFRAVDNSPSEYRQYLDSMNGLLAAFKS